MFYIYNVQGIFTGQTTSVSGVANSTSIPYPTTGGNFIFRESTNEWEPSLWPQEMHDAAIVIEPVVESKPLSKLEFRKLFTLPELIAMDNWDINPAITDEQKAVLRTLKTNMDLATYVDLTDDMTIAGVQYLETCGILATGRAAQVLGL